MKEYMAVKSAWDNCCWTLCQHLQHGWPSCPLTQPGWSAIPHWAELNQAASGRAAWPDSVFVQVSCPGCPVIAGRYLDWECWLHFSCVHFSVLSVLLWCSFSRTCTWILAWCHCDRDHTPGLDHRGHLSIVAGVWTGPEGSVQMLSCSRMLDNSMIQLELVMVAVGGETGPNVTSAVSLKTPQAAFQISSTANEVITLQHEGA